MLSDSAFCKLLGIRYPIIQGGMAWIGTTELVSAVSNAGGLGVIGSGDAPPDWLRDQIRSTKQRTNKPFAVNILLMSPLLEENLKVILEEKVDIVTFGGGNPGIHIPTQEGMHLDWIRRVSRRPIFRFAYYRIWDILFLY